MSKILISFMITVTAGAVCAQNASDVFTSKGIIWYGLDFTHIKLRGQFTQVGSAGFKDEKEIRDIYFPAWNDIIVRQPEKYNLFKTFHKDMAPYELDMINKLNAASNADDIFSNNSSSGMLKEDDIKKIVTAYRPEAKNGIGVVFIMEVFDKNTKEGSMWVTFFDIASGNVLITERMTGTGKGFGLKNYWIHTVFEVMEKIGKSQYKKWQKTYGKG